MKAPRSGTTVPLSTGTQHPSFFRFYYSSTCCHPQGSLMFQQGCHSSSHPLYIPGSTKRKGGQNKMCSLLARLTPFLQSFYPANTSWPHPAAREAVIETFHQLHFHHKRSRGLPLKEDGHINTGWQREPLPHEVNTTHQKLAWQYSNKNSWQKAFLGLQKRIWNTVIKGTIVNSHT